MGKDNAVYIDKHKNIFMVKGNTAVFNLTIKKDGEVYDYSNDLVQLTIKTDIYTNEVLIQKTFANGSIKFVPDDTKNLDYGVYKYDVALTTPDGDFYTVITKRDFEITGRVTENA